MLTLDQLKEIADTIKSRNLIRWSEYGEDVFRKYDGAVQAKQRPKLGKGGRTFTPKATRDCERAIAKWAKNAAFEAVAYPVRIDLCVFETPLKKDALIIDEAAGVFYNQKCDIDNLTKTVLDALNGIAYKDDKQIASVHAYREYRNTPGFTIHIGRFGLTRSEYINYRKLMK